MLNQPTLLELYYYARLTRDVEERLAILYRTNHVVGGLYRSLGQEGESVASALALGPSDIIAPLIRNLGSLLARGVRPRDVFAQYMARGLSPSRGRDLNLHFSHVPPAAAEEPTIIGPISMLGDLIPVLAGAVLAARMQQRALVALTYIGDGGTSTGAFHEGMNFAAVQHLPLIVIAEDNKFAYSTPLAQQMAIDRIDQRAEAYGVAHEMVDGNDMVAVYEATKRAVDRGRDGQGPTLLGVDTMRMRGHAEHDDMRYVPKAMLHEWAARDPIARLRSRLAESGVATPAELDDIDRQTKVFAETEASEALAQPMPDPADVTRDVYAGMTPFPGRRVELLRSPFREHGTAVHDP
ncbi:MAG: thiamine pyrophosphate-dependent dehydrogenase E1 component subunit alpha [Luteitalea sp.]|nr:thiamine pyrophosphate-dependent dehydrogenase E1 component subunit alpha [Luteitalea sp.]